MNDHSVYMITNKVSGKAYVGQTTNIKLRWAMHVSGTSRCPAICSAIKKYGEDAFDFKILRSGMTVDQANELEKLAITDHKTMAPTGYNIAHGGRTVLLTGDALKRRNAAIKAALARPEAKLHRSLGQKRRRALEAARGFIHTVLSPDALERRRVQLKSFRSNPEIEARRLANLRVASSTHECKQKKREAMLRRMAVGC